MKSIIDLKTFYENVSSDATLFKNDSAHFNIIKVEDLSVSRNKPISFTRRSYFKISLVNGHSKIHYADQSLEVMESALVFTNPMIPYCWEPLDNRQTGHICIFTEDFFGKSNNIGAYPIFNSSGQGIIPLNPLQKAHFNESFQKMRDELETDYKFKYDLLRSMLAGMIHEGQKLQPALGVPLIGPNASERITQIFNELLERQFPIEMSGQQIKFNSPSDYADHLNVHVNHLNKALKEITGITTSTLIANRIIKEAKILLKGTVWPINGIAWNLGFEESNHFSAFFRRHTGLSPKQFRSSTID